MTAPFCSKKNSSNEETPFAFPSYLQRQENGTPPPIILQWRESSKFFFFNNALCTRKEIQRYLQAQTLTRLDNIAAAFDLEIMDLVSHQRKKEGVILSERDKKTIITAILMSITV